MAQGSDLQINGRIEWQTKLPSCPLTTLRTSSTFSLLGSAWYLQFSCRTLLGNDCYKVSLRPENLEGEGRALRTPFEVVTYMRDPTDASKGPYNREWHRITERARYNIWELGLTPVDIFVKLDWLRYKPRDVRFVCLFYGADPSTVSPKPDNLNEKSVQVSSQVPRDIEQLSRDFSHLLEKEIIPDVTLECGRRAFRAHRSILAARSEVFRAMFQNGMLESETGTVKVPDLDVAVLEKLLKFIYSGKPDDLSEECTADLYEAADKYAVLSLRSACAYWIGRNLTVENCVKYLKIGDSHSDHDLKATVQLFITQNPSVLKSEAWRELSRELPALANEVFQAYVASTVQ